MRLAGPAAPRDGAALLLLREFRIPQGMGFQKRA
jgi:hypothetical protein